MADEGLDYTESKDPRLSKREKQIKRMRDQELADLDWVLSDPRGRRYINRISCEKERWLETPFHPNSNVSSLFKGKAEHALQIMREVRTERPEMYLLMQREFISQPTPTKENTDE